MGPARVAVDVHVHYYPAYDETVFFDSLCANLGRGLDRLDAAALPLERAVLLTEASGCDAFSRWAAQTVPGPAGYEFKATAEPQALALTRNGRRLLMIIAGRQIVTAERLEVLSAGGGMKIPDGRPFSEVVAELTAAAELAIIPWGAGKWLGRRGRLVHGALRDHGAASLFLADNPSRPACWPAPVLSRSGGFILRGSDPLPFAGEEKRAGAFATLISGDFDPARPLASLKAMLRARGAREDLGSHDPLFTFFRRQMRLRLR